MRFILTILLLNSIYSFAQCDCSANLNSNLKDKLSITHYREFKDWLYQYFQKDEESRKSMKNNDRANWSGKFSAVVDALPISGGSNADWSSSKENQKYYKIEQTSIQNKYLTDEQYDQVLEEKFGVNQLEAYKACLEACGNILGNGVKYVYGGNLEDEFYIQILYNNIAGGSIMLKGPALYSNMEPIGGLVFRDSLVINDRQSVTQFFKRLNPEKSASLALNTNTLQIKPIEFAASPPINQQAIPVGTIVASVLDYTKFLKVNSLDAMNNENMSEVLWIPCDGRIENKSKYSAYSGGQIPDLRGVFLRGINDYRVTFQSVDFVNDKQKNPENTPAGVFQKDAIQGHWHDIQGNFDNHDGANPYSNSLQANTDNADGPVTPTLKARKNIGSPTSDGVNGEPRISTETRPVNVTVYYYIKIN